MRGARSSRLRAGVVVGAALVAALAFVLAGCLIIPTDYHAVGSRHNLTTQSTNLFRIGLTTQEEVLLALGEPDYVSDDGQRFGYTWSKVKAILIVISTSGGGGEFPRNYLIEAGFDASNRVSHVQFRAKWE